MNFKKCVIDEVTHFFLLKLFHFNIESRNQIE